MTLNPPTQYATDENLRARQRLWEAQRPPFDLVEWVLAVAGLETPGLDPHGLGTPPVADRRTDRVLDVGCGNGHYLAELSRRGIPAVGCDLSPGMLEAADHPALVNGDVAALAFADDAFDVVLAPHMLYHVAERATAAHELRRVLRPTGVCVAVTNGRQHLRALRDLVESAVRAATPDWEMRNPSTHAFSLENGAEQLGVAFDHVHCVRPDVAPVTITDASIVADYVGSIADHYQHQTSRPWTEVVDDVRHAVQREIDGLGAFTVRGDVGALVCR